MKSGTTRSLNRSKKTSKGRKLTASASSSAVQKKSRFHLYYNEKGFIRGSLWTILSFTLLFVLMGIWNLFLSGYLTASEVSSGSMEPTLNVGDRVLVERLGRHDLEVGMLVTIKPPDGYGDNFVKRIVGMPGDTVSIQRGLFYLNGEPSPPPTEGASQISLPSSFIREFTLGESQYFVLGDNRANSYDSEEFGPIHENLIEGVVIFRYGPLSRFGKVE